LTDLFEPTRTMKAITLWQPWASLIAFGVKRHETRHWLTNYRGPLAIHASKIVDLAGAPEALCIAVFGRHWASLLPRGAMVAVADIVSCPVAANVERRITAADRAAGNFCAGRFAWRLEDVRPLRAPIATMGRQGLFNWEPPADLPSRLGPPLNHAECCRQIGWA
jgi:hypothetical protein